MEALDLLKVADEKRDQDGLKAANELLRTSGCLALRERLQEGCFAGQAAGERAVGRHREVGPAVGVEHGAVHGFHRARLRMRTTNGLVRPR